MPGAAPATHAQQSSLLFNERTVMHCCSSPGREYFFRLELLQEETGRHLVFRLSHEDMAALVQLIAYESNRVWPTLQRRAALSVSDVATVPVLTFKNAVAL